MTTIQIDVLAPKDKYRYINLYTNERCVNGLLLEQDYQDLRQSGFFIRDGQQKDDAGVWNTSQCYQAGASGDQFIQVYLMKATIGVMRALNVTSSTGSKRIYLHQSDVQALEADGFFSGPQPARAQRLPGEEKRSLRCYYTLNT